MTITTTEARSWDMSVIWPSLESPEFEAAFEAALGDLDRLAELYDELGIDTGTPLDAQAATLETLLNRSNVVHDALETLQGYILCFTSVDTRDDLAKARLSTYEGRAVLLSKLESRFTRWVGTLDLKVLFSQSETAKAHEHFLTKHATLARHLMSQAEEDLAADLNLSGGTAWTRLREDVSSQIELEIEIDGQTRTISVFEARNLASDENGEVRKKAYDAEIAAWERSAVPIAAALNGIKGEAETINRRRGWDSAIERAAFNNAIDMQTLDAMMTAARDSFPVFHRYFAAKARYLGSETLAWWDLFAPIGEAGRSWDYGDAQKFVVENFDSFSKRMGDLARRSFDERWIDVDPKPGKVGGAWCMPIRGTESRVLMNYSDSFVNVTTIAHELGHAYHGMCLAERTAAHRSTPSTLAETASTFCETIIRHAATKNVGRLEELAILDGTLQGSSQVVVDITSRFLFEKSLFEQRAKRELSVEELNEAMLASQRATYGEGVDPATFHKFMWAAKPHYYDVNEGFYNFPYMFGLLFGLGLYARYVDDPETFKASYDELLSMTGMADAATLATRFGIDLRTRDFWDASLKVVEQDIDRFIELTSPEA